VLSKKELAYVAKKWSKKEIDDETAYKLLSQHLEDEKKLIKEKKQEKFRKINNLIAISFNFFLIVIIVSGFVFLNIKTAKHYVGLSTVEMFLEKTFGHVCEISRCMNPATKKKSYSFLGRKSSVHYFCDEHINIAPKVIGTFTPFLVRFAYIIVFIGTSILYIYALFKSVKAAIERYELFGCLGALIIASAFLYLFPTAVTFGI
jgi:hypothetical protein